MSKCVNNAPSIREESNARMNVLLIISRMLTRNYVYRALESAEDALDQILISATNAGIIKFILYVGIIIKNIIFITYLVNIRQYNILVEKVEAFFILLYWYKKDTYIFVIGYITLFCLFHNLKVDTKKIRLYFF